MVETSESNVAVSRWGNLRGWCGRHLGWVLGLGVSLLFWMGLGVAFWEVLGRDVIFFAPDAPIAPMDFGAAWGALFEGPLSLQKVVFLLPYGWAYEGTFWVDAYVMCLAGVFFLRSRGVSWGGAWVGGFCAGFAGYFFTLFCAGHRGVVDALAVSAVAFGAVERLMVTHRWRWAVLAAVALALGLGAQADVWFLMALLLGAYSVWRLVEERALWRVHLPGFVVLGVCFVVCAVPALKHTFGVAAQTREVQLQQAVDFSGGQPSEAARYAFVTDWSLPPEDLLELAVPGIYGWTSYPMDEKRYRGRMGSEQVTLRQHTVHLGWLTVLLAGAAVALRRGKGRREVAFWWGVVGVTVLLALGRYTPLYRGVVMLPVVDQIRAPVKWFHLTGFAMAMLAGLGADALVKRYGTRVAVVLCGLIALNGALVARHYVFPMDVSLDASPLAKALPWDGALYHDAGAPRLDKVAAWNGRRVVQDPRDANVALLDVATVRGVAPEVQPLAEAVVRGRRWGLYRFPILTSSK